MNTLKKDAAVKKYQEAAAAGASPVEVRAMITEEKKETEPDKAKFTEEEVSEVMAALTFPEAKPQEPEQAPLPSEPPTAPPAPEAPKEHGPGEQVHRGSLQTFYKHKVKPVTQTVRIDGQPRKAVVGYERIGEALQVTSIEQHHADVLNAQTQNTLEHYFKEGQDGFLDLEMFS